MSAASPALREILTLDPRRDHQRIAFLTCRCDFPFDSTRALELPEPPPAVRALTAGALRLRGRVEHLLSPSSRAVLRTSMSHRTYPEGYEIETLGPQRMTAPPDGSEEP